MIGAGVNRRGHPLLFLAVLLLGWLAVRVVSWPPPFDLRNDVPSLPDRALAATGERSQPALALTGRGSSGAMSVDRDEATEDAGAQDDLAPGWNPVDRPLPGLMPPLLSGRRIAAFAPAAVRPFPLSGRAAPRIGVEEGMEVVRGAVGHALLVMMGLSQMHVPPAIAAFYDSRRSMTGGSRLTGQPGRSAPGSGVATPGLAAQSGTGERRWSADAWLMVREGGVLATAAGQPSYGRSQAGAVLRYRLAPSSGHAPQAYLRASSATSRPREPEIAGGLSVRPLPRLPIRLAAEVRVIDTAAGEDVRPAAYAVTEFPPVNLLLGTRGEAYVQGGYVGGNFATLFVDGQLRVTREVTRIGGAGVSAGVGAWGGAQKGASRLDIGPSAAVSFSLGDVFSRVSVDYRVRVAGQAAPASGPALTLAAGF